MKKIKYLGLLATLFVFAGCGQSGPKAPGLYADVAKCLTQKNVIMYGAYWCPHCANQKESFGDDFQFVHYQECDDKGVNGNHKACIAAGVSSYPTWSFPGQGNLVGEQQIADLARLANCEDQLPQVDKDKLLEAEKNAQKAAEDAKKAAETTAIPATSTTPASSAPATTPEATAPVTK